MCICVVRSNIKSDRFNIITLDRILTMASKSQLYLVFLVPILLIHELLMRPVVATRTRIGPHQEDPPTPQVYNDLRHLVAHPNYYYLHQAGVPVVEEETSRAFLHGNTLMEHGEFVANHFKFNSSEHIRRFQTHKWFMTIDERAAMHVYDDPREQERSTGPQVNQELCGVHLDYMLHMMRKHYKHITDTTDLAMFKLMNAFDLPHHGLVEGNSVFPGSYDTCVNSELSIVKREMNEMFAGNKRETDKYFTLTIALSNDEKRILTPGNLLSRIYKFAHQNMHHLKPFLGYFAKDSISFKAIDVKAKDKLKTIGTRYCFAGIRWPSWSNSSWSRRHMTLRVATCLPETCDSSSLRMHRDQLMQLIDRQFTSYYSQFYIENLFCLPDESSDFRNPYQFIGTRLFVGFICLWFAITSLASAMHFRSKDKLERRYGESLWWIYLRSWCIQRNISQFFAEKRTTEQQAKGSSNNETSEIINSQTSLGEARGVLDPGADRQVGPTNNEQGPPNTRLDFSPLEGLKVLGSISVMTSHAIITLSTATKGQITFEYQWHSWLSIVATLCPSVVDVFFVITGAMTVKTIAVVAREHTVSLGFWLKYIVYRYLRIIPLYLIVHLFLQHAFRFIGSGPFWDYGTSHSAWSRGCQDESLWRVLLPSANFISPSIHCNGVGWYLANDMQFTLLLPLIIPLLLKTPRFGHSLIGVSCLLGTVAHVNYFYSHDPDARGLLEWSSLVLTRITDDTMAGYVFPQYRFVAYFIGLSLGQLLDAYETQQIRQWPSWLITAGKWYFYGHLYFLCALPFLSSLVLDWDERALRLIAALIPGVAHLTSSIAIGGFIIAITSGYFNSTFTRLLGSRFIKLIASMAHSTMLVHLPLMFYHQQTMRALPSILTKYDMYAKTLVWELEAFLLSFVVHILFEVPLRRCLIKMLLNLLFSRKLKNSRNESKEGKMKSN